MIHIDTSRREPVYRQIYSRIREKILDGTYEAGLRMTPTRELASRLKVSRSSVVAAYEQLIAEGFLVSRTGAGTRVVEGAGRRNPKESGTSDVRNLPTGSGNNIANGSSRPSIRQGLSESNPYAVGFQKYRTDLIDFRTGLPDLSSFPIRVWQRLTREVLDRLTPLDLAYGQPEGIPELREAIAGYLASQRGMQCGPAGIVITAGTTQAIGLITRILSPTVHRPAILEDPVTLDIERIVQSFGGSSMSVKVDDNGLKTEDLPEHVLPRFVYVTPSHHFPLGGILPAGRRQELVRYCLDRGAYIVEDDYDSEFRFSGNPVSTLYELCPERVIYIGTFSKTVFPSLRLAFIVLPDDLVVMAREAKWFTDLHNPVIEQKVLASFINRGHFEHHVLKAKKNLLRKRRALLEALAEAFGPAVIVRGDNAGLHAAVTFPGLEFSPTLIADFEKAGVKLYPASIHARDRKSWSDTLLFGYGMLTEERIRQGVSILKRGLIGTGYYK